MAVKLQKVCIFFPENVMKSHFSRRIPHNSSDVIGRLLSHAFFGYCPYLYVPIAAYMYLLCNFSGHLPSFYHWFGNTLVILSISRYDQKQEMAV